MSDNYFNSEQIGWIRQRRGKLTSSEIHKIFKGGKRKMTAEELEEEKKIKGKRTTVESIFGDGAITYIRSRVTEMQSSEIKEERDFKQTDWGKNNEADAVDEFKRITGLSVVHHGISCPKFYAYGDFAGGSPDMDILGEDACGELKCPYDENIHTKRLLIQSVDQFKNEEEEAWHQCQMNMFIMKKELCYYASFDPRKTDHKLRMKIIKIAACPQWAKEFQFRHDAAVDIMADILSETDKYLFI